MAKKLTGLIASGQTQPEIRTGDIWQDSNGLKLTVIQTMFNRVVFIRTGYKSPCTYPIARFEREFKFAGRGIQQ